MYEKFGQFIDGKWQASSDKGTYEVINPATEEVLGYASKATSVDVDKALKCSEKGLEVWKKTSPWKRSAIIRKISDLIREKQDLLAKWITLEVGKPLAEGKAEVGATADIFEWNSEETKRIYGQTVESRFEDTRIHVYYQPIGVVAAMSPWNFPLVLSGRKISTALAAGCSVIIKPDVIAPGGVMELVNICKEVGVPPGVVNLLSGDPPTIAKQLIASDVIKKIRPLWYIEYSKEEARSFLEKEFGWEYYGGHHLENRMTAFNHSFWFPEKFGIDQRNNSLSASVRAEKITREKALYEYYETDPYIEPDLIEYFKKRLNISDEDFDKNMKKPSRSYKDFKTYKKTFEFLRPLFFILYKASLVPKSFYIKYTSRNEI